MQVPVQVGKEHGLGSPTLLGLHQAHSREDCEDMSIGKECFFLSFIF